MNKKPYGGFIAFPDQTFEIEHCRVLWSQKKPDRLDLIVEDELVAFSVYGMRCLSYVGPESYTDYVFDPDVQSSMFDETQYEIDGVQYHGGGKITCLDFLPERELAVLELRLTLVNEWAPEGELVRGGLRVKLETVPY